MGTSMGTVVTVMPIAVSMVDKSGINLALVVGVVLGGGNLW